MNSCMQLIDLGVSRSAVSTQLHGSCIEEMDVFDHVAVAPGS